MSALTFTGGPRPRSDRRHRRKINLHHLTRRSSLTSIQKFTVKNKSLDIGPSTRTRPHRDGRHRRRIYFNNQRRGKIQTSIDIRAVENNRPRTILTGGPRPTHNRRPRRWHNFSHLPGGNTKRRINAHPV